MTMDTAQVLLVDDDLMLLQALSHTITLRMIGVEVDTVDSAEKALKRVQQHEYDTVVSDIKMPGMDGLELLARVSEQQSDTPVMIITGHGDHDLAIRALRGGAYDYIIKPIDRDDFMASLHRALQTRQLRRQNQEQLRTLERYALSLEQLVDDRTRELAAANRTTDTTLTMVSNQLSDLLARLTATRQLLDRQFPRTESTEAIYQNLAEMETCIHTIESLVPRLQPAK